MMFAPTVSVKAHTKPSFLPSAPVRPVHVGAAAANESMSLVNLAARQRMLSQRMILQTVLAASGSSSHLQAAQKTFQLFCDSQVQLRGTVTKFDAVSAQLVRDTYQGSQGVGPVIEQFMQQMHTTLQCISNGDSHKHALNALITSTDTVLEALNTATTTFDNISKGKSTLLMKELTSIVSDIQTVAREAKVVSFNAQVMAARAGQHGREFAVVANVLSGITVEIDGMSRKAMDLVARNKQAS
jgi:methyl-accepting chemotaxis protein